ncbi:hypothetical protein J7560_06695 [Wohlfahrtiimonas chitiniclastica]|uniref:CBASS cGAMP synthase n=1 Tax=Wohlfahrtiimonas chitiniclastica TaxID=400946 RepID=UPI001BCEAE17|nr:hypothetical protein [Wohlfahrtiimonas chitiniclastica]MBS7815102.1 hypothetical protein [Wohlfahrtiimonas chitiniclastica]
MTWNFHSYYTNKEAGLISQLVLSDSDKKMLKDLRQIVRERTRDVFKEAKQLVKLSKNHLLVESFRAEFKGTKFKHLELEDQKKLSELMWQLSDDLKDEFMKLNPRFWTQGSFMYDTLNRPYKTPPQEMDIDDGTYLPMQFFDDEPAIGHQLLLLLVDASLRSLEKEHSSWKFESKETCGRIKIPARNVHIDVPMYAIPYDKFMEKEVILENLREKRATIAAYDSAVSDEELVQYECIDTDCVNLAVRKDDAKWIISDPQDVHKWFLDACQRNGRHLRKICRVLKAWRDAGDWQIGSGPSSISLMAAVVEIADTTILDSTDFGRIMLTIAERLPTVFHNGVESPDPNDERPLFPPHNEHEDKHKEVMIKLGELTSSLQRAYRAPTKEDALQILNSEYGDRVKKRDLIVSQSASPAYASEPKKAKTPVTINKSMKSA